MENSLHSVHVPYLIEIIAFLLGVVVIVPLFRRIKVSPIIGFLAAGALLGPHTFGVISETEDVQHFAELGVIFLLFTIGLELSFERLKAYSGMIFGLGALQVTLSAIAIGLITWLFGSSAQASIIIGLCLALSSTAMVVQLLGEQGELGTKYGRASFSVLLFQDLAVVPVLILVTVFGKGGEGNILLDLLQALTHAVIAIAAIMVFGRFGLRKLFEIATHSRSIDVFTAMTLLTILTISLVTGMAGLSMALGAFLAGLLLAETEYRHQIEGEIEPFKGLFMGLFFMSVGMTLDVSIIWEQALVVFLAVAGLIAVKTAILFVCARVFGLDHGNALRSGLLLAEGGEFAFVVIGQATLTYNIIDPQLGQFIIVIAGSSMALTPLLALLGKTLSKRLSKDDQTGDEITDDSIHDHIVIAGFGRVGQMVANILQQQAIPFIALDNDPDDVRKARQFNKSVYVGDASRAEALRNAKIESASALLITMNEPHAALRTLHVARQYWPNLKIVVRSRDNSHSEALIAGGATTVVPEMYEASLQLSNYILQASGYSRDEANACIDALRVHPTDPPGSAT